MKRIALAIFVLSMMVAGAHAATYTFDTSEQQFTAGADNQGGWYDNYSSQTDDRFYWVGVRSSALGAQNRRNFFTFHLGRLDLSNEQVVSASLQISRYGYVSGDPSETVHFFDVTTPPDVLNNAVGSNQGIYVDLGSGKSYGAVEILKTMSPPLGQIGDAVDVSLNAAALADITAAAGGYFSIGGSCTTCAGSYQVVFAGGESYGIQQLTLVTAPVPEPSEWAMLVAGLALVGFIARRREELHS
jgi:hypothetical protein